MCTHAVVPPNNTLSIVLRFYQNVRLWWPATMNGRKKAENDKFLGLFGFFPILFFSLQCALWERKRESPDCNFLVSKIVYSAQQRRRTWQFYFGSKKRISPAMAAAGGMFLHRFDSHARCQANPIAIMVSTHAIRNADGGRRYIPFVTAPQPPRHVTCLAESLTVSHCICSRATEVILSELWWFVDCRTVIVCTENAHAHKHPGPRISFSFPVQPTALAILFCFFRLLYLSSSMLATTSSIHRTHVVLC